MRSVLSLRQAVKCVDYVDDVDELDDDVDVPPLGLHPAPGLLCPLPGRDPLGGPGVCLPGTGGGRQHRGLCRPDSSLLRRLACPGRPDSPTSNQGRSVYCCGGGREGGRPF